MSRTTWAAPATPVRDRPTTVTSATYPPPLLMARISGHLFPRHPDELHGGESMSSSTTRRRGRFGRRILLFMTDLWVAALSFTLGNAAWSYFAVQGMGAGSASDPQPPLNVSATFPNPIQRTVEVTWSAPTEPGGIILNGYYVTRFLGSTPSPACGTSPTALTTSLSCQDTGLTSNTYTYSVTAVFRSWSSGATSTNVTVPVPILSSLTSI